MAYQFTQTGQEIQDILNQVGDNTADIAALGTRMTTAEGEIDAAQNDITALNTSLANIGTVVDSGAIGNTSIATATYLDLGSISLTKGTWILFAKCVYSTNATGLRTLQFGGITQEQTIQVAAGTTGLIGLTTSSMATLTSTTTVRIRCWQNSGATLNVSGRIFAVRIA